MVENNNQVKSKQRVSDHGEVFTSKREVNAMLDLVKQETERIDSRFLEPACGTGNFLVEILSRKLNVVKQRYRKSQDEYERYSIIGLSSIYGIDLLQDNVFEAQKRLFGIFDNQYSSLYKNNCKDDCRASAKFILNRNILKGDALTLKSDNDEPIVFTEWSAVNGNMLKRRDFTFDTLLKSEGLKTSGGLFEEVYDTDPAFLPEPIKEYPLIHFLKLADNG